MGDYLLYNIKNKKEPGKIIVTEHNNKIDHSSKKSCEIYSYHQRKAALEFLESFMLSEKLMYERLGITELMSRHVEEFKLEFIKAKEQLRKEWDDLMCGEVSEHLEVFTESLHLSGVQSDAQENHESKI